MSSVSMYDLVGVNYKPTTRETRETYEALLTAIQDQLGDQPRDVLIGAADEVLTELKSEKSKDLTKRSEVEAMLGKLEDSKYYFLCNLSKKITDYQSQTSKQMDDDDVGDIDEYGVNVEFENSDESEQEDLNYIRDDDDSDDDGVEATSHSVLKDAAGGMGDDEDDEDLILAPREIDAFWLQRKLNDVYDDPLEAQKKEEEVMAVLQASPDRRQTENQLVLLLSMSNFSLIRILCENAKTVLWCTKLMRANKNERKEIEAQMKAENETAHILKKLQDSDEVTVSGRKKRKKVRLE
jgi:pre-mRNA-splicing helicase BRR2